ncbi:MAG: lysostaphin resistance A-like protein [Marmoricola sp.]
MSDDLATSYPLALRTPTYTWKKPVAGLLVLVASALLVVPIALMPLLAVLVWLQGGDFTKHWTQALEQKPVTPGSLLYLNLTLAALVLVAIMIVWLIHRLPVARLMSIKPGIRWKFFFVCLGISVVAIAAQFVVAAILPGDTNGVSGHPGPFGWTTIGFIAVIVFSTPLQAMGEEYAFRGYAMQAFGSLTKSPWFAILLSAVLFTAAHGTQNVPLLVDRFAFGLLAGYLVLRTGGLEAGIALHVLNNLVAFGFALAFGDITNALNTSSASWWQLPVTVTQNGVYLLLVLWTAKRMGITGTAEVEERS